MKESGKKFCLNSSKRACTGILKFRDVSEITSKTRKLDRNNKDLINFDYETLKAKTESVLFNKERKCFNSK